MRIITISREFGSGGRELGKRLADELGYAYYDKEIISKIASEVELDEEYVDHMLTKGIANNFSITYASSFGFNSYAQQSATNLLLAQQKILRRLAMEGNCVIVGRSANEILKDLNPLSIFVYADMESKIKRCLDRATEEENLNESKVKKMIKQIDSNRVKQHELHSDLKWGAKEGYNLCIDTSNVTIKKIVPIVAKYAMAWFEK